MIVYEREGERSTCSCEYHETSHSVCVLGTKKQRIVGGQSVARGISIQYCRVYKLVISSSFTRISLFLSVNEQLLLPAAPSSACASCLLPQVMVPPSKIYKKKTQREGQIHPEYISRASIRFVLQWMWAYLCNDVYDVQT